MRERETMTHPRSHGAVVAMLLLLLCAYSPASASTHGASSPSHLCLSGASVSADEADEQSVTVYVTRTGTKYHTATYHHPRSSKIAVTKSEAIEKGYSLAALASSPSGSTKTRS